MLKELTEYGNNIKEEMKITPSEIKKNLQGTNRGGDETKNQINCLKHRKKKNIQSEQQEEKRIQKNENSVRSIWDNFKPNNNFIMRVPESEDREQIIDNLFEKIMTANFPNLVKKRDIQVQGV